MNLDSLPVVFMDCQTTGASPANGELLEIAWLHGTALNSGELHSAILQTSSVAPRIESLTGISDEHMRTHGQDKLDVLKDFLKSIEGEKRHAVIHFSQFETPFLNEWANIFPLEILCTYQIARRILPNFPTRGVRGLAAYFGMPLEALKRAEHHVRATEQIWKGLVAELKTQGLTTLEELQNILSLPVGKKSKRFDYPMERLTRLKLPDLPGVYRMKNQSGRVLYVGKATSLKSRVNSYFRSKKNRDPRKTEMLMQVRDIEVTPCKSPLEAALLETDEIKRFDPPFNINLKTGQRRLHFFSRDFKSVSEVPTDRHPIGPFASILSINQVLILSITQNDIISSQIFFDPIDQDLIHQGFETLVQRYQLKNNLSVRQFIALGLKLLKRDQNITVAEPEAEVEDAEIELTPDSIADKFERLLKRVAGQFQRSRILTKLLNSNVSFESSSGTQHIEVRGGKIDQTCAQGGWQGLGIADYDRMSVLLSELTKCHGHISPQNNL